MRACTHHEVKVRARVVVASTSWSSSRSVVVVTAWLASVKSDSVR